MIKILGKFIGLLIVIGIYLYIYNYAAEAISKPNYGIALIIIVWAVITIIAIVIVWDLCQDLWDLIKEKLENKKT